tara:strand:- start:6 stop:656 length:651 start_codon:yes stop_codon:yes gene_type:complete
MAETFTMKETPVNSELLNSDEQDSLAVAESLEGGEQPLLAGKFKDPQALEQAYVELQKKLGEPRDEVQSTEDEDEPTESGEEEEEASSEPETDVETLSEAQAQELIKMVGGEKTYQAMLSWAGDNFSKEQIEMYDSVMESGNPNAIFFAVQALQSQYNNAVGSDGQLLTGRGSQNTDDSFKSQAELVAAMSDPRYDRDPAYRADLMRRLENSDIEF